MKIENTFKFYKTEEGTIFLGNFGSIMGQGEVEIPIFFYGDKVFIRSNITGYTELDREQVVNSVKFLQKRLSTLNETLFVEKRITLYKMKPVTSVQTEEGAIDIIPFDEISLNINIKKGYSLHINRVNHDKCPSIRPKWFKTREKLIKHIETDYLPGTFDFMLPFLV